MGSVPSEEEVALRARLAAAVSDLQSALGRCPVIEPRLGPSGLLDAGRRIADALEAANGVTGLALALRQLEQVSEEALMLIGAAVSTTAFVRAAAAIAMAEVDRLLDAA